MESSDLPLTAIDALDPKLLPDHKLFTMFLDWAKSRRLIDGYYLIIYHQTGPLQGLPTPVNRLPRNITAEARRIVEEYIQVYETEQHIPNDEFRTTDDGVHIYRTSISRTYDINLGILVFLTRNRVRSYEVDQFIRFMEGTVSIRKQAIAFALNPPFIDLAMQGQVLLDVEVGKTVVRSIEANETHVLSFDEESDTYSTAFSTKNREWIIDRTDPVVAELGRREQPIYFQDSFELAKHKPGHFNGIGGALRAYIDNTGCRSALIFDVKHDNQRFALAVCLFARARAVSLTEVALARRLQISLSEYYRLGFERHKSARASQEAEEVEQKAREALLIADIMHDATDDLLAARASIENLRPRNELEKSELENARRSLKQLLATSRLFRFLFNAGGPQRLSVEEAMATGKGYYTKVQVREIFETLSTKYQRVLKDQKITVAIQVPPSFAIRCMEISVARAIDNCLKNSIRHLKERTSGKKSITLAAKSVLIDGEVFAELSVHDTGVGIEPSVLPKIRKPFVSYSGGMGLGLAIVGTVCDIHKGKLDISSEWGSWTRVAIRLPQVGARAKGR